MEKLPMTDAAYRGLSQIVTHLRFFRLLKGAQFDRLLARMELRRYARGETVFHKGDPPLAFYIIYQGGIRIHLGYRLWGLIKRVAHLGPGDVFGERALMRKRPHSATATASAATQLFVLSYEQFDELMRDDPDFADLIRFAMTHRRPIR